MVTFDPAAPASAVAATVDAGHALTDVTCPALGRCVAVDDAGRTVVGDPAHPAGWTIQPVPGAEG